MDAQRRLYPARVARLERLLRGGSRLYCARSEAIVDPAGTAAFFERIVTRGGAEGLVLHASEGRTFKVKPEISIDAAVIGFAGTDHGIFELLLALITPSGRYQSIGRVRTFVRASRGADGDRGRDILSHQAGNYRRGG
jgi:hypothetical protein